MLSVAESRPNERALFIQRTYLHLAGAIGMFTILEVLFFMTGLADVIATFFLSSSVTWLGVIGGFALLGWLAKEMADKESVEVQYLGLGLYVLLEAIIFIPLLFIATKVADPSVLPSAVVMTLSLFAGLTAIVFTSKKDFTFMGGALKISACVALGLIVSSLIFGFQLGIWFSAAMIVFAAAAILYDTSRVMNHYQPDQYVAASLQLFASVAVLFWYILRILIALSSRR
jgi:hypothetical protein